MRVLVSVSSVHEAQLALSAGVRLIDLKETSYGALAALDLHVSKSIMEAVNTYRYQYSATDIIVSATVGDDCTSVMALRESIESRLNIGVDIIKLPETIWANTAYQVEITRLLCGQSRLIAVLSPASLTDPNQLESTLQQLASFGYWGVMVDTLQKSQPLTAWVGLDMLAFFVNLAKSLNLYVGLAGGLRIEQFDQLADIAPDYLGFRSGLCVNQQRGQSLIADKVRFVVSKLSEIC